MVMLAVEINVLFQEKSWAIVYSNLRMAMGQTRQIHAFAAGHAGCGVAPVMACPGKSAFRAGPGAT
jgi:hypothetical protein